MTNNPSPRTEIGTIWSCDQPSVGPYLRFCSSMRYAGKRTYGCRRGSRIARKGSGVVVDTRPVVVGEAAGRASVSEDLLLPKVAFFLAKDDFRHFIGKLLAITDPPFGKEIVLDPDNLIDSAEEGSFASEGELRMRHESFGEDILDVAKTSADVHIFDV